jgi:uncharacterized protein YgbK (DUF1537 family)
MKKILSAAGPPQGAKAPSGGSAVHEVTSVGVRLGCIADDFTGATDLANNLVRAGMRVVQVIGVPDAASPDAPCRCGGGGAEVAHRAGSRRRAQSLAALRWLRSRARSRSTSRYCSTFDSTPQRQHRPVTEALMDAETGRRLRAIATPAFPDNGRTVFKGHLFVGDLLLSDSGMRHHPLTPMTDANLVRVLQAQCRHAAGSA